MRRPFQGRTTAFSPKPPTHPQTTCCGARAATSQRPPSDLPHPTRHTRRPWRRRTAGAGSTRGTRRRPRRLQAAPWWVGRGDCPIACARQGVYFVWLPGCLVPECCARGPLGSQRHQTNGRRCHVLAGKTGGLAFASKSSSMSCYYIAATRIGAARGFLLLGFGFRRASHAAAAGCGPDGAAGRWPTPPRLARQGDVPAAFVPPRPCGRSPRRQPPRPHSTARSLFWGACASKRVVCTEGVEPDAPGLCPQRCPHPGRSCRSVWVAAVLPSILPCGPPDLGCSHFANWVGITFFRWGFAGESWRVPAAQLRQLKPIALVGWDGAAVDVWAADATPRVAATTAVGTLRPP
jgi:hypothetical protein